MKSFCSIIAFFIVFNGTITAQDSLSVEFKQSSKRYVGYSSVLYGLSLIGLNQLWYQDFERSSFHHFDDNDQWLQMDKIGHTYSAYALSNISYSILKASVQNEKDRKRALVLSSGSSFIFLTTVEVFDGFSKQWGFSWGDVLANSSGIALFGAQELLFDQQYVRMKYSFHESEYRKLRPETLGHNILEASIKDYNGQTYWLSANINDFVGSFEPNWLNIAIGYGGSRMIHANGLNVNELQLNPFRQYYIGFDLDLEKIRTNKKWIRTTLKVLNHIKFPAPTLEINQNNETKFHWLYF